VKLASKFVLSGTGIGLPLQKISSSVLDERIGKEHGWIESNTGVAERWMCGCETQEELGAVAARQALVEANLEPAHIDAVIFASAVPKQPIPATAPLLCRELGIPSGRILAFDINTTCLSFLTALDIAVSLLDSGRCSNALIVSSEIASRALPWANDPATAGLFGDGAAAAILRAPDTAAPSVLRAARFETYHEGYELCQLAAGGTGIDIRKDPDRFMSASFFAMNGPELFRLTAKHYPGFVQRLLDEAGWSHDDVDLVVPHQASPMALQHLVKRCGFASSRVVNAVAHYGNQVAASLPTMLHLARNSQKVFGSAKVLLLGTSAGVSFGGLAIEI
jgi:3-oxoacyl-[acyl-carrier-protein] synthase III